MYDNKIKTTLLYIVNATLLFSSSLVALLDKYKDHWLQAKDNFIFSLYTGYHNFLQFVPTHLYDLYQSWHAKPSFYCALLCNPP